MNFPTTADISAWVSAVVAAVLVGLGLWVKASKANADVKRNTADGDTYSHLTQALEAAIRERDAALADARSAWGRRTEDAAKIAHLEAREVQLTGDLTRLREEFESFRRLIVRRFPESADFMPSGPGALPPHE